ncbi:TPA: ParB N-terminal domain-containing protein [Klebsiella quasipneumoniae]|jgi:ParB/RepB/Spo0J family partition protein|uniref:ParB/RepB/Spo0J family partition protein n=1 Tax=Klebsiella TaxID=570 RepID=UPI00066DDBA1|nr:MULTISPECIES: ParB N-terminal domain-containing protein [Klebsiella]HCM6591498.1 ParB N-terminal domain-containing protein [Klebsiella quasipneumoniae]EKZ5904092.1 ParB N-terminal domain-containing protein [Klebsiella pneumoniae]ELA2708909.1 ParB N-terminal domain-containing protein [Klebsiella pneumoniae]KMV90991.1 ParB-like partition protein [Klebsiella oxytoca 10-5249]MBL1249453.1 ParB N-terminal domain-containing protein [Klebsiella pneumoniae]
MQWIVSKSMGVKITILQVEVARLRPNPWNTNSVGAQNFEKLKGSIEKLGFFKPILARELDGGQFEILGGEHRWRAAMEQGISTVPVISVGKISDLVAKQMSLVDNERYGEDDQVALQRLIEEIQSELDYQLSEIAPYDDELAATLARESAIDLEMLEALSRGDEEPIEKDSREKAERVGAEHQTMRFKVTFDASDRVTETIKSIIKEQAINTGNDMENAGEALVWLVDNYKECI